MPDAPRLVTLTIELRYDMTVEEQAVFDGDDESAQAKLDQTALIDAVALLDQPGIRTSRFRLGMIKASTGSSWISQLPS